MIKFKYLSETLKSNIMDKEFYAKWLLDIAKYLITAVAFSNMFDDLGSGNMLIGLVIAIAVTFIGGSWLLYVSRKKDKKENKK